MVQINNATNSTAALFATIRRHHAKPANPLALTPLISLTTYSLISINKACKAPLAYTKL